MELSPGDVTTALSRVKENLIRQRDRYRDAGMHESARRLDTLISDMNHIDAQLLEGLLQRVTQRDVDGQVKAANEDLPEEDF